MGCTIEVAVVVLTRGAADTDTDADGAADGAEDEEEVWILDEGSS